MFRNKISNNVLLYAVFILCGLASCNADINSNGKAILLKTSDSYFKTLLIIGDDRSGSTNDIRKLTIDDYKVLGSSINNKGGGTLAVCLIGNPQPQSREPYILTLNQLENPAPFDSKDTHLTLTEKSALKIQNDKIAEENNAKINLNENLINDYISNTIDPKIIHYKPSGIDHTDLDDAIQRINTLVNEPQYKDYQQIIVVLVSDGKNQPGITEQTIIKELIHPKAMVYLIGWEMPTQCFKVADIEIFSAKEGVIEVIKNLK